MNFIEAVANLMGGHRVARRVEASGGGVSWREVVLAENSTLHVFVDGRPILHPLSPHDALAIDWQAV